MSEKSSKAASPSGKAETEKKSAAPPVASLLKKLEERIMEGVRGHKLLSALFTVLSAVVAVLYPYYPQVIPILTANMKCWHIGYIILVVSNVIMICLLLVFILYCGVVKAERHKQESARLQGSVCNQYVMEVLVVLFFVFIASFIVFAVWPCPKPPSLPQINPPGNTIKPPPPPPTVSQPSDTIKPPPSPTVSQPGDTIKPPPSPTVSQPGDTIDSPKASSEGDTTKPQPSQKVSPPLGDTTEPPVPPLDNTIKPPPPPPPSQPPVSPPSEPPPPDSNCVPLDLNDKHAVNLPMFTLIKYTDRKGSIRELRLTNRLKASWRDIGVVLGISESELQSIVMSHFPDGAGQWFKEVISMWMKGSLPSDYRSKYPLSWNGIIKVLNDADLNSYVEELKEALACPILN